MEYRKTCGKTTHHVGTVSPQQQQQQQKQKTILHADEHHPDELQGEEEVSHCCGGSVDGTEMGTEACYC
jgi:hypothetical protein